MELHRGVCSLCSENTRVLTSSDAEDYSKFLSEILYENFLTESEFQKIKKSLKVCVICCYKIQLATETKSLFNNNKENEKLEEDKNACHFCKTVSNVVRIETTWKNFVDKTQGYTYLYDFPLCACPRCIFFFETISNMKIKLMRKFPQLAHQQRKKPGETQQKQNDTPKRKSPQKSPPSSKKRKIFDNCFTYLQPLCNNKNYHIDSELKRDKRLYKKIAYVNLQDSKDVNVKETPKMRPIIKIKLKPKKDSQMFVKLTRPTEPSPNSAQTTAQRHSSVEKRESSVELDETPKAATTANLVPKRRVSVYMDNGDKEEDKSKEESDEIEAVPEPEVVGGASEEDDVVEDLKEEKEIDQKEVDEKEVDENGVANQSPGVAEEAEETEELPNGEKPENLEVTPNNGHGDAIESVTEEPTESPPQAPLEVVSSSDGSDSDSVDKNMVKGNTESDSVNGSERKKKRVTFSDEYIE